MCIAPWETTVSQHTFWKRLNRTNNFTLWWRKLQSKDGRGLGENLLVGLAGVEGLSIERTGTSPSLPFCEHSLSFLIILCDPRPQPHWDNQVLLGSIKLDRGSHYTFLCDIKEYEAGHKFFVSEFNLPEVHNSPAVYP